MQREHAAGSADQRAGGATEYSSLVRWYDLARSFDPKLQPAHLLREPTRNLRYARRARRAIRRYEPVLEKASGKQARRFKHYWRLFKRFGHKIDDYYRYGFYDMSSVSEAASYLSERRLETFCEGGYKYLGVDASELLDKVRFAEACHENDLSAIPTIAEIVQGRVTWGRGRGEETLPEADLISKPREGKCGDHVLQWAWNSGAYLTRAGERLSSDALLDRLREQSTTGPMMIQPSIHNSEPLLRLAGGALCTVRLVTSRPHDGVPEPQCAVLKMPTGSKVADNFANDGIAAPIEIETGEVGTGVVKSVASMIQGESFHRHPDTNEPIAGLRLSDWRNALDLCIEAHRRYPEFHSIGWDLAITNVGPVLLEGNHDWDPVVAQQPGLSPLGKTGLIDHMLSFFAHRK